MSWFQKRRRAVSTSRPTSGRNRPTRHALRMEHLERRELMAGDVAPVLMVVADQQDFYYQEYGDTRQSIEAAGLEVVVAATTTSPSVPHPNTGQGADGGVVTPDIGLADVDADDYSAIVFVGGWGSSMYQYDFPGTYSNNRYNGDLATKQVVNELIGEFLADDKHVAAICHGVTVLAWARVDGESPLSGRQVSSPYIGSPAVYYNDTWYGHYALGQYEQVVANGGIANTFSGQYGDPATVADDVVVDGRIITAENYDAAAYFGQVVAQEVLDGVDSDAEPPLPPPAPPVPPPPVEVVGSDLVVHGTPEADTVYVWSGAADRDVSVWLNGVTYGVYSLPEDGQVIVHGGDGNDEIFATSLRTSAVIHGDAGHDLITGGSADDQLYGGPGVDRLWANAGDDIVVGGDGNDYLFGREGNDILLGGPGNDHLEGYQGNDILIGGAGNDYLKGGADEDLLIGGTTSYDEDLPVLAALRDDWSSNDAFFVRVDRATNTGLQGGTTGLPGGERLAWGETVHDDGATDVLCGQDAADLYFASLEDDAYGDALLDQILAP